MLPERRKSPANNPTPQPAESTEETADVKLISMATYALLRVSEAAENLFEQDTIDTRH